MHPLLKMSMVRDEPNNVQHSCSCLYRVLFESISAALLGPRRLGRSLVLTVGALPYSITSKRFLCITTYSDRLHCNENRGACAHRVGIILVFMTIVISLCAFVRVAHFKLASRPPPLPPLGEGLGDTSEVGGLVTPASAPERVVSPQHEVVSNFLNYMRIDSQYDSLGVNIVNVVEETIINLCGPQHSILPLARYPTVIFLGSSRPHPTRPSDSPPVGPSGAPPRREQTDHSHWAHVSRCRNLQHPWDQRGDLAAVRPLWWCWSLVSKQWKDLLGCLGSHNP